MGKITIKEIAREAGVSIATVSNVLNNKPNKVSEEKKQTIQDIIAKYNYAPNLNARALVHFSSKLIGILYYSQKEEIDFTDPFISEVLTGIEAQAKQNGHFILVHGFSSIEDIEVIQKNWKFDGFIVVGAFEEIYTAIDPKLSAPTVYIDTYLTQWDQTDSRNRAFINNNDLELSFEATNYLLANGHSRIAFYAPMSNLASTGVVAERYRGFEKAFERNKQVLDKSLIFNETALFDLVERQKDYSAVLVNSDYLAMQLMAQLKGREAEFKSLIGFDNIVFSKLVNPSLTSVELNQKLKGKLAIQELYARIQKQKIEGTSNQIIVAGKLIERDSVRKSVTASSLRSAAGS